MSALPFRPQSSEEIDVNVMGASTQRELRVLQVFHGLGMGGAETWLMSLLKCFQQQNVDAPLKVKFDVLLTGGEKAVFDDEATALGARLFYVPFTRRKLPAFIREFRRIIKSGNYNAIHDHQDYIAGLHFAMGIGLLPRVRIAHVHNPRFHITNYLSDSLRRLTSTAGNRLLRIFATDIAGTSLDVLRQYGFHQPLFSAKLSVAHCGFDPADYCRDYEKSHSAVCGEFGWEDSAKLVLFVGRLEGVEEIYRGRLMSHKNPELALEIAKESITRNHKVRVLMVGAGDQKKKELEKLVGGWGMANEIRFLGVRFDVPRLMSACDVLLFPSLAEGLGMVVVEAQAAGLRVLASDTTPRGCIVLEDMVEFCSLDQIPAYWAERLLRILSLPRPNSNSCQTAVKNSSFSIQNSAARLVKLYGGML
jgi:glycosyltransferase EpsF